MVIRYYRLMFLLIRLMSCQKDKEDGGYLPKNALTFGLYR
jgi:hypothetical protein